MIFFIIQLQEKCREQRRPLYIAFIDLTKAFYLVSKRGLFTLLQKIGCPTKLLGKIMSFHEDMQPFPIKSGVKQDYVRAPTLFGILLMPFAFSRSEDGTYTSTLEAMEVYSTSHVFERRPRCGKNSYASCPSLTTQR